MPALLLGALLTFSVADADRAYETAKVLAETCSPRDAGTPAATRAANFILDHASAVGADVRLDRFTADTPRGKKNFVNLYAEFCSNPTGRWVVVCSHYDTKSGVRSQGANDGASTAGLLIGFTQSLVDWHTPHGNVILLWLDGEECMESYGENDGLWGSRHAAARLKASGRDIRSVICVDMLGDRDLSIGIPKNGTPGLKKIALYAAKKEGLADLVSLSGDVVRDDHLPFLEAGFMAIDLIDFEYGPSNAYWHSEEDTVDKISRESIHKSGRLLARLVGLLL